ncbi:hypothetical protein CPter291_2083 [Collimonas pratensis]|uniref:Uncharacterized protein n=1 Tax=Collimonas pratensis TaxID=279113 RepID=A0ABN4MFJ6_9BURK|nr:hypothetical protein CPter291_2083 [Collimonas pratensis]
MTQPVDHVDDPVGAFLPCGKGIGATHQSVNLPGVVQAICLALLAMSKPAPHHAQTEKKKFH